ncbi:hypothetical protein [Saccharopolyspora spinosa]|nr:hypothetical protein [Saccharopolyspora spinosa]
MFGNTMHAFMAPQANSPELGIQYDERSAERSWSGLKRFLTERLAAPSKS